MNDTKLTVRVPREWLDGAKRYAKEHDTTLTRLISEYLRRLSSPKDFLAGAPTVQRLSGSIDQDISLEDYQQYLDEKYG